MQLRNGLPRAARKGYRKAARKEKPKAARKRSRGNPAAPRPPLRPPERGTTARIQALPLEQLEALADALLDFQGMDDLTAWLAANT